MRAIILAKSVGSRVQDSIAFVLCSSYVRGDVQRKGDTLRKEWGRYAQGFLEQNFFFFFYNLRLYNSSSSSP